jgi:hypothetical protein
MDRRVQAPPLDGRDAAWQATGLALPGSTFVASVERTGGSRGGYGARFRPSAPPRPASRNARAREPPHPLSIRPALRDAAATPLLPAHRIWFTGKPASYLVNQYTGARMWIRSDHLTWRHACGQGARLEALLSPCPKSSVSSPPRPSLLPDRRRRSGPGASPPAHPVVSAVGVGRRIASLRVAF